MSDAAADKRLERLDGTGLFVAVSGVRRLFLPADVALTVVPVSGVHCLLLLADAALTVVPVPAADASAGAGEAAAGAGEFAAAAGG